MAAPDLRSARWRKSSYSGGNGGNCVEVAFEDVTWHKSSYSNGNGGNCVEVAHTPELAAVRDSKNPTGPTLVFTRTALAGFLRTL
jgi:uncharacterized protein DUF397